MSEAQHHPGSGDEFEESYDSPDQVLAALHSHHQVVNTAEVAKLRLAVRWAVMHPVESITHGAATVEGTEGELAIAGPGAPLVAEFCVADLALALGMSTDAGRTYLGDALELRYRLPKLWAVVTTGRVPVWRARKIAHATKSLCPEAAAYVDTHLAHQAHRCSFAQIDRAVADALRLFDPAEADKRRREAADARHFDIDTNQVSFDGTVHVDADLDLADALDLNDAITTGAAQLGRLGCDESLDVRRSLAAGALARRDLTLDLQTDQDTDRPAPPVRKRELMIYLHLSDRAVDGAVAGVENTRSAISVEQVKDWCAGTNTRVTIRPVIDLNDNLHTDAYRPTDAQREQAVLTNATCVYPHCSRPSRSADLDHVTEPQRGCPTDSANLAPLCRGHHRYKTHGGWTVERTGPTTFTWTSRYGYSYDWDTRHTRHTL
ncbi:hypothetical protein GCM10023350_47940 [Nocardioides endophyticus]|uniref:DUF222 domain-containing protein n=1 Tax=Nocardioides endophyticus TaxID=1353775 RepID=A0ABP8ZH66_9ACTN